MSLQIFQDYAYNAFLVTIQQQYALFGGATNNAIVMSSEGFSGDYIQKAAIESLASQVGNRNVASTAAATEHAIQELLKTEVKVGAGTPNISFKNTDFDYTQRDPAEAGAAFGMGVAEGIMAYQLNSLLAGTVAAVSDADVVYDGTASTANLSALNMGAGKFGDRQTALTCWIMHSKSMTDIYGNALANSERLFTFGNIRVMEDGLGRPLVMVDSDALHFDNAGTENYIQLGLVTGGAAVMDQGDMRTYQVTSLEQENAKELMKAESTFGLAVKGYSWNTSVEKPTDAQLATVGNWSRVTGLGHKDTAGVKVITL